MVPGYVLVKKIQIKAYLAAHLILIRFPPLHRPPLGRPWGTSLHKQPNFFMAHMIVDTLWIPNLPKSAYPYFH